MPSLVGNTGKAACLLALLLIAAPASAQVTVDEVPNPAYDALLDRQVAVFSQFISETAVDVDQQVMNGIVIDRRYFPAILGKMVSGDPHPTCTATLIGLTTLLIAAHCVDDNPDISLAFGSRTINARCVMAPAWNSEDDKGVDLALCVLANAVQGMTFERISFRLPAIGEALVLSGFGCTEEGGEPDGELRLGWAPAQNRPPGLSHSPGTLYTVASIEDGQSALCPRDSGGPLFRMPGAIDGPREVIAVNSATTYAHGVSLFAALGAPANAAFIRNFAAGEYTPDRSRTPIPVLICGVNMDRGCEIAP